MNEHCMQTTFTLVVTACFLVFSASDTTAEAKSQIEIGNGAYSTGDYRGGIRSFTEAIQSNQLKGFAQADVYSRRAFGYLELGMFDKAIADLDSAIDLAPSFAWAYSRRCWIKSQLGEYDQAKHDCDTAIELNSNEPEFYNSIAEIWFQIGRFSTSIDYYSKAIKLAAQGPQFHLFFNRGNAFQNQGKLSKAIKDYSSALELQRDDNDTKSALYARSRAHFDSRNYKLAIDDITRAIALDPRNANYLNARCWINAHSANIKQAISDCNKALEIVPNSPYILDSRGYANLRGRNYKKALNDLNEALRLEPTQIWSLYHRGLVYEALGKAELAEKDFRTAASLAPTWELLQPKIRRYDIVIDDWRSIFTNGD